MDEQQANENTAPTQEDVETIRQILFGEQARQTADRFEFLENAIASLRRENTQLRQLLEAEVSAREKTNQQLRNSVEQQNRQQTQHREQQVGDLNQALEARFTALNDELASNRQAQIQMLQSVIDVIGAYKNTLTAH